MFLVTSVKQICDTRRMYPLQVFLMLMLSSVVCNRDRPYINYKILKITAGSWGSLGRILEKLQNVDELSRNPVENSTVVLASPDDVSSVYRVVTEEEGDAWFEILQHNVQNEVDEEFRQLDKKRRRRQTLTLKELTEKYLPMSQIYAFQRRIVSECRDQATVQIRYIGYSAEKRLITILKISRIGSRANKKSIFIEAGMHAREWLSPATANYIIYQLACRKENTDMLDLFNWEIVSVVNTDGYEFSRTKGNRYWRKNRQRNAGSKCVGTDLNRNFAAGFGAKGSSPNACYGTYRGKYPYSAPETNALRAYVGRYRKQIISYLSIHTYGQYIFLPWGYKSQRPPDFQKLMRLAKIAEKAMGLRFKIGSTYKTIYPAAGISPDFARDHARIALSYTWELMPNNGNGYKGFAPSESQVKKYTPVIWKGLRAYAKAVAKQSRLR